jgi:hypothetical protein
MILSVEDTALFFKLYKSLLLFINNKWKIYKDINSFEQFNDLGIKRQIEIRNKLYEDIQIIDEFYAKNPANLTELELGHVLKWKNFIQDKFLFYKQYKKYCAVFYGKESIVLGVKGLSQPFDEILPFFPIYVQTVLLPFKNHIVSDGYFEPYSIYFSGNIKKVFKRDFDIAKSQFGIVDKLPFEPLSEIDKKVNRLKYYVKHIDKYPEYEYDIQDLLIEEPALVKTYHQEIGKKFSKFYSKKLLEHNFGEIWFACLDEIIVASGTSEQELKDNMDKIVPEKTREFIYIFKL